MILKIRANEREDTSVFPLDSFFGKFEIRNGGKNVQILFLLPEVKIEERRKVCEFYSGLGFSLDGPAQDFKPVTS